MTDTTDRENLELAAKAAGMIPKEFLGNCHFMDGLVERWNPRHNNRDSFVLAARLKLQVAFGTFKENTASAYVFGTPAVDVENTDIEAAAREAIFLMAVEIGRGMK